jgi:sulfate permease, SulP family
VRARSATTGVVTEASASIAAPHPRAPHSRVRDLWGGLAAALVALPSSIAFGVVAYSAIGPAHAGAGALAGIVGAAVVGIVAPLVSRNGGFISAPCAPAAAVLSAVAIDLAHTRALTAPRVLALLTVMAALSALLQTLYGALRAGRLIKFIPYQVVSGYLSGVALIIAAAQIPKLLGAPPGTRLLAALSDPSAWRWPSVLAGVVTIAAMMLTPKVTKRVPGAIVGLAAGVGAYLLAGFLDATLWSVTGNPLVIGPVQSARALFSEGAARLEGLRAFEWKDLALVIGPSLTLSVLLSIDTLKTGIVLDAITQTRSNSNRELIGQGVANAASCVLGGMPGAGTAGPTLVNLSSGGRTALSGVLEGSFVLLAFVALGPLVAWVPIGALAGILLVIAFRMFDTKMFVLLASRATRLDFFVIAAVVLVAETVGLIEASAVGVFLAILLFIRDQIRSTVVWRKADLRTTRSKRRRTAEEAEILQLHGAGAVIASLRGNLFFGTTDQLFTELEDELKHARFLLLDLRRVGSIDFSAANLLKQMRARLAERGGDLLLAGMPSAALAGRHIGRYLASLGLTGDDGVRVFDTRDSALEWMEQELLATWGYSPPEQRALALEEMPLFRALDGEALMQLRGSVRELSCAKGAPVFRAGDEGHEVFFVRRGRVHALLPLPGEVRHHLATFGQGELFGELGFLDRVARTADAEAAVDTELFALSRTDFDALAAAHPAVGRRVFEQLALALAQRLRQADTELRALEER